MQNTTLFYSLKFNSQNLENWSCDICMFSRISASEFDPTYLFKGSNAVFICSKLSSIHLFLISATQFESDSMNLLYGTDKYWKCAAFNIHWNTFWINLNLKQMAFFLFDTVSSGCVCVCEWHWHVSFFAPNLFRLIIFLKLLTNFFFRIKNNHLANRKGLKLQLIYMKWNHVTIVIVFCLVWTTHDFRLKNVYRIVCLKQFFFFCSILILICIDILIATLLFDSFWQSKNDRHIECARSSWLT